MIDFVDVSFSYNKNKIILDNIGLKINTGEFIGILGVNGSGKTTLLKLIARLIKPDNGGIYIKGKQINSFSIKEYAKIVSLIFQEYSLVFDYNVSDLIQMGRYPYSDLWQKNNEDKNLYDYIVSKLGIIELLDRNYFSLSGGERKLVMVAKNLYQDTDIILLDEAIANLDLKHKYRLYIMLKEFNKVYNKTIISTFHDINFAFDFCDRIIVIDNKKIALDGSVGDIFNSKEMEKIYGVDFIRYDKRMEVAWRNIRL